MRSKRKITSLGGMYQQTKNTEDIGSRGVYGNQIHSFWWNRLTWLQNRNQWPSEAIIKTNEEMEKEAKKLKTVLAAKIKLFEADKFNILLEKYSLWKFLCIMSWVLRFINNMRRIKKYH